MAALTPIRFTIDIAAPPERVFRLMLEPAGYEHWTAAFAEGSRYEGSWQQGAKIRFVGPSGDGMLAEIAEHRANEFISIRHVGMISRGVEDTTSDTVRAWTPALENYTFTATPAGTRLVIDQEVAADFEADLADAWPKALQRLRALCEGAAG